MREEQIVYDLSHFLKEKQFYCFKELQITNRILDVASIVPSREFQEQIRIDLAAIHPLDGGIVFIEAESNLYVEHPLICCNLADYVFLACPEEKVQNTTKEIRKQQFEWATQMGLGIVTLNNSNEIKLVLDARLQGLRPEIRMIIMRAMSSRDPKTASIKRAWWASHTKSSELSTCPKDPLKDLLGRLKTAEKSIEENDSLQEAIELLQPFMEIALQGVLMINRLDFTSSKISTGIEEGNTKASINYLLQIIEQKLPQVWEHIKPMRGLLLNHRIKISKILNEQRKIKPVDAKRIIKNCWLVWNTLQLSVG